jgi:hypothetical protein
VSRNTDRLFRAIGFSGHLFFMLNLCILKSIAADIRNDMLKVQKGL